MALVHAMKSFIFECKICLWLFESRDELRIHNHLEHMIGCRNWIAETDSICNAREIRFVNPLAKPRKVVQEIF